MSSRRASSSTKHPCVFRTEFHKEQINLRLAGKKVPFGDFTRTWRREHCATINPYGSDGCPYASEDCSLAFLHVAQRAMDMDRPGAYFRVHAKLTGLDRSENKPLERDRIIRTHGQQSRASGLRDGPGEGPGDVLGADRQGRSATGAGEAKSSALAKQRHLGVRGTPGGLQRMGQVLRGDDPGPRTRAYGRHEGEAASDYDGDARDPVPTPPPKKQLGDQSPSSDKDLHQGGQ